MNIAALLLKSSRSFGERPALALGNSVTSNYGDTSKRVAMLAGSIRGVIGLFPGDRVAIAMKNCPEFSDIMFATWHAGCAAVPMNAKLHEKEFTYVLNHSGAKVCFVTEDLEPVIKAAIENCDEQPEIISVSGNQYQHLLEANPIEIAELDPDALAWLFYTSGTLSLIHI